MTMYYLSQLEDLAKIVKVHDELTSSDYFLQNSPVLDAEGELAGFITDDLGGSYHYREATEADRIWWSYRPRGLA